MEILETRDDLLATLPKNLVIAELGVFTGAFASRILDICEPAELHLIDLWEGRMVCGDKDGQNVETVEQMELVYLALVMKRDPRYTLHRGTTQEMLAAFPDDYFDFIYIDADHSEAAVYADLVLSKEKSIRIGGHDYCDSFPGVVAAVDRFCKDFGWEITHLTKDGCPSYMLRQAR